VRAVEQLRARARPQSALATGDRAGIAPLRRARAAVLQGCSRLAQCMQCCRLMTGSSRARSARCAAASWARRAPPLLHLAVLGMAQKRSGAHPGPMGACRQEQGHCRRCSGCAGPISHATPAGRVRAPLQRAAHLEVVAADPGQRGHPQRAACEPRQRAGQHVGAVLVPDQPAQPVRLRDPAPARRAACVSAQASSASQPHTAR